MADPFPRTRAAQRDAEADWIGIYASEQLGLLMHTAQAAGTLGTAGAQWLQHCLPVLEAGIEAQCPVELDACRTGVTSHYGFPRTTGYPVVVAALRVSPELEVVQRTAACGILPRLPLRAASGQVGPAERWQIINAAQTGDWGRVKRTLKALMGGRQGESLAAQCRTVAQYHVDMQPVVTVLIAGNVEMSAALVSVVALPAIEISAEALRINLG
jgi:hypothetical protein